MGGRGARTHTPTHEGRTRDARSGHTRPRSTDITPPRHATRTTRHTHDTPSHARTRLNDAGQGSRHTREGLPDRPNSRRVATHATLMPTRGHTSRHNTTTFVTFHTFSFIFHVFTRFPTHSHAIWDNLGAFHTFPTKIPVN